MKPSDLRQHAYTWAGIANSADERSRTLEPATNASVGNARLAFQQAAAKLHAAVDHLVAAADELEARNAS